jgi:hypothetical protein
MTETTAPPSIEIYEVEQQQGWVHDELDLGYIDQAARDIAESLARDVPAEVAYQPGDGTFYGLVIVPLRILETARPRVVNGVEWDRHACRGMGAEYERTGYLVAHVDHRSYAIRLGGRMGDIASSYIAEHWDLPLVSACSVAILLRAVNYHLDLIAVA